MLTREFFHKHPEISLIFALSLGYKYKFSLNLKDKDKPFDYAYNEFSRRSGTSPELSSYLQSNQDLVLSLKNEEKPFHYGYNESKELSEWIELYQETYKEDYYFNERHFTDKKVFLKRREYLEFALQEIPSAWDLYEKVLEYEDYPEEISGILKPETVIQLLN